VGSKVAWTSTVYWSDLKWLITKWTKEPEAN